MGWGIMPVIKNNTPVHGEESPILHMKREKLKAIQYTMPTSEVKKLYPEYTYDVLDNEYITFKYSIESICSN